MEGSFFRSQKLWKIRTTRLALLIIAVAFVIIGFQNTALPFGSLSQLPISNKTRNINTEIPNVGSKGISVDKTEESFTDTDDDLNLGEDGHRDDDEFVFNIGNGTVLKKEKDGHIIVEIGEDRGKDGPQEKHNQPANDSTSISNKGNNSHLAPSESRMPGNIPTPSQTNESKSEMLPKKENVQKSQNNVTISNSTFASNPVVKKNKKKKQPFLGMLSISDMDRVLVENRASSRSMIPRWHSKVDRRMLYAKEQIEKAPVVKNDEELYAPVFRNLSTFKRSYELMEQMLKVYVYKEGVRPIFHTPFLTGIYASEGWFMKQMEKNRQFVVNDPTKAHLFYMPFSSRMLQQRLYVANSHSHKNLIEHLKNYVRTISSNYPFWNRTGGADHFLAGCHDWATHETSRSMETAIRALCNADVREGFEIGKDVSLPETYVANGRDPLRSLGGKPSDKRTTLAFFAGQMHGYLRPILLQHWENKDPSMVISGPIPHRVKRKKRNKKRNKKRSTVTTYPYLDYMKDSKYCICPRGYEVNSPRVVEAIFYGCVPVIISDNYVPPFFEVLDWSAFSVVLPEKDVPRLKEVLVGIPRRRYVELERGVRGVRRHFLWNRRPKKYDLFHMILHDVWFNRLYQIRLK